MVTFLEPEKIIKQIDLKQDWYAAEFGCGTGAFTIALAKTLLKGMVYALDIQEEPLSALAGRARVEGLSNIKMIQCDIEEPKGSTLKDDSLDLVLVTNILFQSDSKEAILKEARRIVKPERKVVIVDWKTDSPFGPEQGRVSLEEAQQIMVTKLDMKLVKEIDAGTYHWGAIFVKA
jgi:ubiquinone/menaquinone biosynthesis C-methylase UbiE